MAKGRSQGDRRSRKAGKAAPGEHRRDSHVTYARWLVPACIAVATAIAFAPALQNGFVSWDDPKNFLDNPHYRGLGPSQLSWMWSTFLAGHYIPLTWMTLGADYLLWGMNPMGYHATSVLIHVANAVLLFFVARRLLALSTHSEPRDSASDLALPAAFAALFFSLHPLRVESVAWITERRDTLSLFFYLVSVLAYLRFRDAPSFRSRWYWTALGAFACALLSKGTAVTLPAVLVLLNVYPLRRVSASTWRSNESKQLALELAPFVALAAAFSLLSVVALHPPDQLSPMAKLAVSAYSLELYVEKTLIPIGLSPLYQMPRHVDLVASMFIAAYVSCIALALAAWMVRRRWPAATAALAAFVVITLPMLGLVQNGPQIAADRYTYHSGAALALLAAGILFHAVPLPAVARRTTAAIVLLVLAVLTWNQTSTWHDSERLWTRVLDNDSTSSIAHTAMANVRYEQGRLDEGLEHSRRAVELAPDLAEAHNDFGVGLARRGQVAEATEEYHKAIALRPKYEEPLNNLGLETVRQGDIDGGIAYFRRALEINPDYADAHVNWGNALVRERKLADAIPHYQAALTVRPNSADARFNWGVALAQQGRFADAASQFQAAVALDPNHAEARDYLAKATRLIKQP
jgi:Tfp pilus assembly protein PilF